MENSKQKLFERMNKIGGMPINEESVAPIGGPSSADPMGMSQNFQNEDQYAEKAGTGQGIISNLVSNIEEALKYIDQMWTDSMTQGKIAPAWGDDLENIKKRLTLGLDNAKQFVGEGKEHKRKGNIRGMWGVDDDNDGIVDGAEGGDGGGE